MDLSTGGVNIAHMFWIHKGVASIRIVEDVGLYYLTFSVVEWLPVFIRETAYKMKMVAHIQ
jgi:hypothetical protein